MGSFVFFAVLLALIAIAFAIATLWQRSRGLPILPLQVNKACG